MNSQILVKYILIYFALLILGFFIATNVWWFDTSIMGINKYSLLKILAFGICWFGTLSISLMLSRFFLLKEDRLKFMFVLGIHNIEYCNSEIGMEKTAKLKNRNSIIAFPLLFLTITAFILSMNSYEKYQLKLFGIENKVEIKKINFGEKRSRFVFVEYTYNNKKYERNLSSNTLNLKTK